MSKSEEKNIGFKAKFTLKTSVAEVWAYFVEGDKLEKWLGFCDVVAEVGGDYVVSSRLPFLSGRHRVSAVEVEKRLSIDWFVDGVKAGVDVHFSENGASCEVDISGVILKENIADAEKFKVLHGFSLSFFGGAWQHALFNLKQVVEGGGSPGVQWDLWKNNGHVVHLEVDIDVPKERAWQLLTSAEELNKMGPDFHLEGTKIELKKGGVYSYGWYPEDTPVAEINDGPSRLLDFVENERLLTNWHSGTERQESIEWLMVDAGDGKCRLTMIHKDILKTTQGDVWSYRSGWTAELYSIKWYLEGGQVESDWWEAKYEA